MKDHSGKNPKPFNDPAFYQPPEHSTRARVEVIPTVVTAIPNNWNNVTPKMFGPKWDYELENHITLWIFTPVSEAAIQWCSAKFPDGTSRYGARGYIIEAQHVNEIVKCAARDKLMSPEEYEHRMNEAEAINQQGFSDESENPVPMMLRNQAD